MFCYYKLAVARLAVELSIVTIRAAFNVTQAAAQNARSLYSAVVDAERPQKPSSAPKKEVFAAQKFARNSLTAVSTNASCLAMKVNAPTARKLSPMSATVRNNQKTWFVV